MTPLNRRPVSLAMAVAAMGVVFGDVGTSPLYAFRAVFTVSDLDPGSLENVLGVLSLIFWSITLVVGIKYVAIVLRADNEGEGGVLALMQLVTSTVARRWSPAVMALGLAGCALFFGDGVITPAISVLSAALSRSCCRWRSRSCSVCSCCSAGARVPSADCSGR